MTSYAVRTRSPVTSRAAVVYAHKNETIDVITSKKKKLPDRPTLFNRRHGIAVCTKVIACTVHIRVSSICPSRMNRLVCLFRMLLIIVYITIHLSATLES